MTIKIGATTVANNSGNVSFSQVTYTANSLVNNFVHAGTMNYGNIVNVTLINGTLTITTY